MHDPYLYKGTNVLKNKLNIRDQELLNAAEADYVVFRIKDLALHPLEGSYNAQHFLDMHHLIFQDIYEWAGCVRTVPIYKEEDIIGYQSIEYSDVDSIMTDLEVTLDNIHAFDWEKMSHEQLTKNLSAAAAALWRIHPFREGNTRTTISFCTQYADEFGFIINRKLFEDNSQYVRKAFVAYNAYFADGTDFSKKEYLERIVGDALTDFVRI